MKQTVIYSIDGLENAEHTIKLETSGGNANCIVVDAFEVLGGAFGAKLEAQLIINNQWYYPNLGWEIIPVCRVCCRMDRQALRQCA